MRKSHLVLSRSLDKPRVVINCAGQDIEIDVVKVKGKHVSLCFSADPDKVIISRAEVAGGRNNARPL